MCLYSDCVDLLLKSSMVSFNKFVVRVEVGPYNFQLIHSLAVYDSPNIEY